MFWYFPPDAGQLNLIFNICVTYMTANGRIIILVWTEWIIFNAKIQTLWSVSWGQTYSCIIRYKEVSCVLFCKQLISVSQKWSTFHLSKMVDVFFYWSSIQNNSCCMHFELIFKRECADFVENVINTNFNEWSHQQRVASEFMCFVICRVWLGETVVDSKSGYTIIMKLYIYTSNNKMLPL